MKIRIVIFLLLGTIILNTINHALVSKALIEADVWGDKERYQGFYLLEDNSLDYLVLGSSHTFTALSPMQVYGETGYTGYHLGNPNQPQALSYYWLKEAYKTQSPHYVFIDVSSLLYTSMRDRDVLEIRGLLYMKPSVNKWNAIKYYKADKDTFYTLLFPIYGLHSRWADVDLSDFSYKTEKNLLKGAIGIFSRMDTGQSLTNQEGDATTDFSNIEATETEPEYELYVSAEIETVFRSIYDLCQDNGSILIPVKFPTKNWTADQTIAVTSFLDKYDLELLNIASPEALNINWSLDSFDRGNHANYFGMTKSTLVFSQYLKDLDNTKEHPEDDRYQSWNEDLKEYREWEEQNLLSMYEQATQNSANILLPDGIYTITSAGNIRYTVDVMHSKNEGTAHLALNDGSPDNQHRFMFQSIGNGLYTIKSLDLGQYLTVEHAETDNGGRIILQDYTGLAIQKWMLLSDSKGRYQLVSLYSGRALNIVDVENDAVSRLQLWELSDSDTQRFWLTGTDQ